MAETTSMKEACSCCGSSAWTEAHFVNGSLICSPCAREIRRTLESKPMPPTPAGQRQLDLWVRGPSFSRSLRSRDTDTPAFPFSGSVASGPFEV